MSTAESKPSCSKDFFVPASYDKPVLKEASQECGGQSQGKFSALFTPSMDKKGQMKVSPNISISSRNVSPQKSNPVMLSNPKGLGTLDLSQYDYKPADMPAKSPGRPVQSTMPLNWDPNNPMQFMENSKKRRRFMRPRKNSKLEKLIAFLADKRVDDNDGEKLEDLQLPAVRRALNIIFITTGIIIFLAVISVIVYTSIIDQE
ncbi:hypothetical protein Ciccas_013791 [Cichlidogyrus casuarinus]|uniref:Uncharacterized protein n=1 Tax=Cichlidogyrus casuarinus TaxID=1844966 RepID=A0ABD2PKR1_9PLAT